MKNISKVLCTDGFKLKKKTNKMQNAWIDIVQGDSDNDLLDTATGLCKLISYSTQLT